VNARTVAIFDRSRRGSRRRRRRGRAAPGFTLVEVLAAMLIMAVVLPVAMRGVSLALAAASSAKHMSEASSLGESKLNQLVVEAGANGVASSGDFAPDHPGYQWSLQTVSRDYGLTELDLTVTWQERGQAKSLLLTTLTAQTGSSTGGIIGLGGLQ
jgi:prepilin-type N-terminal cleavage/methylation domain-containing protein